MAVGDQYLTMMSPHTGPAGAKIVHTHRAGEGTTTETKQHEINPRQAAPDMEPAMLAFLGYLCRQCYLSLLLVLPAIHSRFILLSTGVIILLVLA